MEALAELVHMPDVGVIDLDVPQENNKSDPLPTFLFVVYFNPVFLGRRQSASTRSGRIIGCGLRRGGRGRRRGGVRSLGR